MSNSINVNKMSFLYLDEHQNVRLKNEAKLLPCIKDLRSNNEYNNEEKFNKVITIIFHCYSPNHMFSNFGELERIDKVSYSLYGGEDINKILENEKVRNVIKEYKELSTTPIQRLYNTIKTNIDEWKLHISNIPIKKRVKVSKAVQIDVNENGENIKKDIVVDTYIDVDNSKEALEAIKTADAMIDLEEKIRRKVQREEVESDVLDVATMLDSNKFDI